MEGKVHAPPLPPITIITIISPDTQMMVRLRHPEKVIIGFASEPIRLIHTGRAPVAMDGFHVNFVKAIMPCADVRSHAFYRGWRQ